MRESFERGGSCAQASSVDAVDVVVGGGCVVGEVGDAYDGRPVVGVAVDIGLVEAYAVRPLLDVALLALAEPVARPVGRRCSADDEPEVLCVGGAVEGEGDFGLVVGGGGDVAVDACAVFL